MAYSPAVEKLLIEKHGFTKMDDGTIVSPQGTFKDDSGSCVKYTPPAQETSVQIGGGPMETYTGIDTSNLDQFAGTGGTDTVTIDGQTFQDFDTQAFAAANQAPAGIPGALPPEPTQTMDDLTSALDTAQDLDIGAGTRYKNRESDLTGVKYSGSKPAFEYDLGEEYDNVVAVRQGGNVKFYKDGERLDRDETADALGLDSLNLSGDSGNKKLGSLFDQLRGQKTDAVFEEFGGKDSDLVQQYLADEAADAKRRARKDKDAFYGRGTDSTGRLTSMAEAKRQGKEVGDFSDTYEAHQARLDSKTGEGFLADVKAAGADLASRPGEFVTDFSNLVGSIPGGITDLVDNFQRAVGLKPSGAIYSSSDPLGRPTGLFDDPNDPLNYPDELQTQAFSGVPF